MCVSSQNGNHQWKWLNKWQWQKKYGIVETSSNVRIFFKQKITNQFSNWFFFQKQLIHSKCFISDEKYDLKSYFEFERFSILESEIWQPIFLEKTNETISDQNIIVYLIN